MQKIKQAWTVFGIFCVFVTCLALRVALFSPLNSAMTVELDSSPSGEERRALLDEMESWKPRGAYVLVDTALNRVLLEKGDRQVLDAPCSTGSGKTLKAGEKTWIFETPRGEFVIQSRLSNPIWRKPDWAFLEEGLPVPSPDAAERYEKGVLGEYAFGIGNGYFLHGTLYTRLLGSNVTHGCVRLGRDDLRVVSSNVRIGTKVYIF